MYFEENEEGQVALNLVMHSSDSVADSFQYQWRAEGTKADKYIEKANIGLNSARNSTVLVQWGFSYSTGRPPDEPSCQNVAKNAPLFSRPVKSIVECEQQRQN